MASVIKQRVMNKLKADGAKWEWETPDVFSAWLPDGKVWSGYNTGTVTQTLEPNEGMGSFWDGVYTVVMNDVIDEETK